jgi:hypothetical protein
MRIGFVISASALISTSTPAFACDLDGMFGGRFSPFAAFAHRPASDGAEVPKPVDETIGEPVESPTMARSDAAPPPTSKAEVKAEVKKSADKSPAKSEQPAS